MKTETGQTLADLLFGENSMVPPVEIRNSQEKLINALLNYATNLGSEEFQEGLNDEIDDSETRRLISAGMGAWNLSAIVGRADMYPEKKMNFGNLVRALFPDPEKLLELLFAEESPLNHISKEVRSLCWDLAKQAFKNYYNMEIHERSQFVESITYLLFKNIDLGREADISHCMKQLSDLNLFGRDEFNDFQQKMGRKVFEIAESISQRNIDSQTKSKIKNIKFSIDHMYNKNKSPSEEMIRSALTIFELDFPYEPQPQKDRRNEIRNLATQILSRSNPNELEMLLEEWVSSREISKSINVYGSLLHTNCASQTIKGWCAEELKKIAFEITNEFHAIKWAFKTKGKVARKSLARIGVTKESLISIFQDQDFAQKVLDVWDRPIERVVRENHANEAPRAPTPEKFDSSLK